jgi:prepilin-type N-terminal cleavage/methylation domain-containing protein
VGQRPHAVRRNDSGFTLTELLIVIVILGVLSGIVVFAVGQFSNRGESSACKAAMKTSEVAIETFRANTGRLPANMGELVPSYLRSDPSAPQYAISINFTTGAVTGDLTGGATTTDCSA